MKYNLPPFNEKEKRGTFEQKILDFSTELFRNPKLGLGLSITLNILYIYSYFKSKGVISILLYLLLAYFGLCLILTRILRLKRNK